MFEDLFDTDMASRRGRNKSRLSILHRLHFNCW